MGHLRIYAEICCACALTFSLNVWVNTTAFVLLLQLYVILKSDTNLDAVARRIKMSLSYNSV